MFRGFVFLTVLGLLGAACNDPETRSEPSVATTDDESSSAASDSGSGASEVGGGHLVVGFTNDQYILEGEDANFGMYELNADMFETLTYLTTDYQVEPFLATDWEFIPPNTWRFHLREDVVFHDGEPMTAQDVKEGLFDRLANQHGGGQINAGSESTEVVDEHTVDFTPTEPNMRVPQQLVHPSHSLVAPDSDLAEDPIGTGPFQFVEYEPDEHLVVKRFDDYRGEPAQLDRITFRFYPEAASRRLALQGGDIHAMFHVPRADIPALEDQFQLAQSNVGTYRALNVNATSPPLNDRRLRQALAYGIDRKALIGGALGGHGTTDQTLTPPAILGDHASLIEGFTYDPDLAESLIEEAGWEKGGEGIYEKEGEQLEITLVSGFPSAEDHKPFPSVLQSQLREIGVSVEIVEVPDSATFFELVSQKDGDLFLGEGNQNNGNPAFLANVLYYTGPGSGGGGGWSETAAPGEEFNRALLPIFEETDIEKVRKATAEALHILLDEETTVIPLVGLYRTYALDERVQGFTPHPSFTNVRWGNVSLE